MKKLIKDQRLLPIANKIIQSIPANEEDLKIMLQTKVIIGLSVMANEVRMSKHRNNVYYGVNMNLNYTNICELRCPLCAFSKDFNDSDAYFYSIDDMVMKVKAAVKFGIDEVHIVGGLYPDIDIHYFETVFKEIKKIDKSIIIVALTAVEVDYYSKISNLSINEFIYRLKQSGWDAMPGGGAEIFSKNIRDIIAPKKISGELWLDVMQLAHENDLKTNATMLYNHIEQVDDVIDHLQKIRDLQSKTNGFKTFVPLPFHNSNDSLSVKSKIKDAINDINIYAAARIYLFNIPHIKALWMYIGEKLAQVLLHCGVDDIGGTYYNEKVVHAAGATTPAFGSEKQLVNLIENAGLLATRTSAIYN